MIDPGPRNVGGTAYADIVRTSIEDVVEAVLAKAPGSAPARQHLRMEAEHLATALIDHTRAVSRYRSSRPPRAADAATDSVDVRARAFRIMAGVRA